MSNVLNSRTQPDNNTYYYNICITYLFFIQFFLALARNLAGARLGRISDTWPDSRFARARAQLWYNPIYD